ncbi:hypothetical protein JCM9279_003724 [Rhodotorula babjevae]
MTTTASYESFPLAPPPDSPSLPASSATDPSPFARLRRFLAGAGGTGAAPPQDAAAPAPLEPQQGPPASQAPPSPADALRYPTARQALESALGAGAGASSAPTPPGGGGTTAPASRAVSRSRSRDPAAASPSPAHSSSSPSRTSHPGPHPHPYPPSRTRTRSRPPPSSPSSRSRTRSHPHAPPDRDHAPHPTQPNERFVRPLRLSGAPRPSVRVSLQQAETSGILSSSVGASSVGGGGGGGAAGDVDSPTLSEGYFAASVGAGAGGPGAGSGWASGSDAPGPPFLAASSAGGSAGGGGGGDVRKRRLSIPNLGASFPGFKRGRSTAGGAGGGGGGGAGGSDEDDDARSVVSAGTGGGYRSSPTAYELMRRLRGEGLSKTYWIKDESARECFQCQSTFTTFRRKHHCRICGQIFCINCASHILPRLGHLERVRVCDGCRPTALKHESSSASSSRPFDDGASAYRYRAQSQSQLLARDEHALAQARALYRPPSASGLSGAAAGAPAPYYHRHHSRLSTSSLPDIDDDDGRLSRASSGRMRSPIFEEGEREAEPPPRSPKSSIAHKQLEQQQAAAAAQAAGAGGGGGGETQGAGSAGDGAKALPASAADGERAPVDPSSVALHSPALSAAAPFRRELGDEEHETADEAGGSDDEGGKNGSALLLRPPQQGLGLDLDGRGGGFGDLDGARAPSSPHIRIDSSRPGSTTFPPDSPFLPRLDRSMSRISGHLVPRLPDESFGDAFLGAIDPDVYHADAFRAAEAVDIPLSPAALAHIRRMIAQSLAREQVPHAAAWEPELERLLFDVADRLATLDEADLASGGPLDVHAHVRVKRIPGGRPRDSEFVNGVVFTKNVMHKKMARELTNPKVMLLSFPLDFLRADGKYLDLDTVLRQEKEYLQNVVARIQNHFPQIILVERNVSSRALELLRDLRDVAVARHVKRVALDAVARSFGAEVVPSPHALLDSKVGRCARFRVQTFVHPLIPGGRKTLLRFEGSTGGDRQTGCTLVLRGASMDDLAKVKRIVNMLVLVVYNAKLEGYLLHDQRIEVLPPIPSSSPPTSTATSPAARSPRKPAEHVAPLDEKAPVDVDEDTTETLPPPPPPPPAARASTTTARISATLAPYQKTALSGSPLVHYPPPYPLARMAAEDRRVREMREMRDKEETMRILVEEEQAATASTVGGSSIMSGSSMSSISASSSSAALDMLGGAGGEASLSYDSLSSLGSVLGSGPFESGFALHGGGRDTSPHQQPHRAELAVLQQPEELARQSQFADAEEEHALHLAAWEAYHRAHEDSFDPHDFQQLFVLESLVQVSPRGEPVRLCRPPEVHSIAFYGEGDTTIGQYLKFADGALRSGEPCPSPSCHESLRNHRRIFVHDGHVLHVSWEPWNNDVLRGAVGMSTECRHVGCRCGGRLVRAATETIRLSFGKFLELSFYSSHRLACADDGCGHDGQLEHVRHWHYGGVRVAIRIDKVDLRDVVAPPRNVKVRPDRQLELRNAEYQQVLRRSEAFFASVQVRVAAFKFDGIPAERVDECKAALGDFSARCEADRKAVARLLRLAYEHAHDSNGTEMTTVRRALQEKSHAFDAEWASFVKRITPFDMQDMRRASVAQLKRYLPDGTQRGASGPLPPAIEVEEHLEDGSGGASCDDNKSPDSPSAVDRERLEEGETQALRDAEVRIDPPAGSSLNSLDPLASSTATILPSLLSTAVNLPRPPPLSRTNSSFRRSSFGSDFESDSTICADGEPTTVMPRTTSPFIKRRQLPAVVDETSAAESELETPIWQRRRGAGGQVASLVSAYDSGSVGGAALSRDATIKAKHGSSPARPTLRRSQTEKPPPPSRPRPKAASTFHETDSSYARIVGVSHLMAESSLSAAAARPSRIPSRKPIKTLTPGPPHESDADELVAAALVPGLGVSTSPTSTRPSSRASSRAPSSRSASRATSPTATRSRSAFSRAGESTASAQRPPLKPSSSSRSTIKGKSRASAQLSESSDAGALKPSRGIGLSRPTASTANKVTRRAVSTGTGRHVTNMRRHFENVSRQNEKQQAMRKRARPIITSQPTVQIFENIRDAIKEDSDDEDDDDGAGSDAESGGADDEFDDEQEPPERDDEAKLAGGGNSPGVKNAHLRLPDPTTAPSTSAPTGISSMTMSDALARSSHGADPAGGLLMPPPALEQHSAAEPSDSDFPSIPPSPVMPDSFTFPRMSEGESSGAERRSIFNAFSSLWNYRNGDFSPLAYPTLATEHVYADNPVVLRDDEPTSLIAHALSSKRYYQAFENANLPRIREGLGVASAGDEHPGEVTSFATQHDSDVAQTIEEILRASTQRSFKLGDVELGDISARCTVFWVEQFEALRRQCGCDKQFVESLSRCFKWDAAGGKSKVDFMKTLDDRFIVKQLSRPEMEVFARFAPAYFQYMADALFQGKPTVLAKVFGIYRISLGKEYRNVDFLVMENLFYGRQLKQIFDLKGSTRNRRADENNPVLLDENLLEVSLKTPFYVREESKQFIKQAIFNDSQFLSDLNVMDYSLVVGVDAVKSELLVGIVDYIRTYTWDKRIESWVKETTFLGGASKAGGPTVITPKQYKLRFREAIDGYLLLAPTPWLDLKSLLPIQPRPDPPKADAGSSVDGLATGPANAPVPPSSAYPAPPPSDTSSIVAASLATM